MGWTSDCRYFADGVCGVASQIVGGECRVTDGACAACMQLTEPTAERPNAVVRDMAAWHELQSKGPEAHGTILSRFGDVNGEPKRNALEFTFGFSTRDDYDGAWMTIEGALLYHRRVFENGEIVVIDNSPEGSEHASLLEKHVKEHKQVRYIRASGATSSCLFKDQLFREARGEFVLCCDSHVLFEYGALESLLQYYRQNPGCSDLLSGPAFSGAGRMVGTQQHVYAERMTPEGRERFIKDRGDRKIRDIAQGGLWAGGALGVWAVDEKGVDPAGEPFEVDQQGTGCFSCRREAWPGFLEGMQGHGGNETYLMERFRERGDRVLSHPALRWVHRFGNPRDGRYPGNWPDRVRNYLRGFVDLDRPDLYDGAMEHFAKTCPKTSAEAAKYIHRPTGLWEKLSGSWFTKPGIRGGAIPKSLFHELRRVCEPGFRTLEFGCGLSTLLFNELKTHHEAIEHDAKWRDQVLPHIRKGIPVTLCDIKDGWYEWKPMKDRQYDVILVDGPPGRIGREGCLRLFPGILRPGGTVIVDDTHREKDRALAEEIARKLDARLVTRKWGKRRFAVITTQPCEAERRRITQPDELPCVHRGELVEWRQCKTCTNGVDRLPVYSCSEKTECVVRGDVRRSDPRLGRCQSCAVCEERQTATCDVSVVIPCHNYAHTLEECIRSVLSQSARPKEIVVLDDASEDDTADVAARFPVQYERVEYRDVWKVREHGFRITSGSVLCFLDADDRMGPNYLEEGMKVLDDPDVAIAHSDLWMFGSEEWRKSHPTKVSYDELQVNNECHAGSLVRRVALETSRAFNHPPTVPCHADWTLWKAVLKQGWTARKSRGRYEYRKHPGSMMRKSKAHRWRDRCAMTSQPLTIAVPLSGRVWDRLAWVLTSLEWDRSLLRLLLLDSSQDAEFNRRAKRWAADSDFASVQVLSVTAGDKGLADQPRVTQDAAQLWRVNSTMCYLWETIASEITTEWALLLEDDIEPPPNVLHRLSECLNPGVAGVCGAYRSRYQDHYSVALRGNHMESPKERGNGVREINQSGFGCLLVRSMYLREHLFDGEVGRWYDPKFFQETRRKHKVKFLVNWDIPISHGDLPP